MLGREEKVSTVRLTAVQYIVLFIFLLLAYGLWRLQVMHSGKYEQLAEQNRVRDAALLQGWGDDPPFGLPRDPRGLSC